MKNLIAIFGTNNCESNITKRTGVLTQPGDRLEAYVTKSGRNVLKIQKGNGDYKYSATQYPTTGPLLKQSRQRRNNQCILLHEMEKDNCHGILH